MWASIPLTFLRLIDAVSAWHVSITTTMEIKYSIRFFHSLFKQTLLFGERKGKISESGK
jgi:hypothetical protein